MKTLFTLLLLFVLSGQLIVAQEFTEQTGVLLTGVSHCSTVWGDYNNDGYLDILLSGYTGSGYTTKIYKNNGNNTFTEQTGIYLTGAWYSSAVWGDYNNDGYLDILLTGDDGSSYVSKIYKNNGDNTFTEQTGISLTGITWTSSDWGDYNNDGYLDVLLSGNTGSSYITKIYKNNKDNTFTEQTGISLPGPYSAKVAWGDYNNDGYLDILLTGSYGSGFISRIYQNNGNDTFSEQAGISLTGVYDAGVAWGDYNNDGYLDLLITGDYYDGTGIQHYTANIYKNNGNDTFTTLTGLPLTGVRYGTVAWGDYDNDGDLDIILSGHYYDGTNNYISKIYKNNGNDSFTEQTNISLSGVWHSCAAWGDYDNDGDLDLLISGTSGNSAPYIYSTKLYKNNTTNANSDATEPANLQTMINGQDITFKWNMASDSETPQDGLSYNLYVYEEGQTSYKRSPHAFPQTHSENGKRLISQIGNIQYNTDGYTLKGFSYGNYKWSVQAIDGGLQGGPFAAEQSFSYYATSITETNDFPMELYPNPIKTELSIEFTLAKSSNVNIEIIDITGKAHISLLTNNLTEGKHKYNFESEKYRLKKGMHMVKLSIDKNIYFKKIVIL
jgi:hypothetical protein